MKSFGMMVCNCFVVSLYPILTCDVVDEDKRGQLRRKYVYRLWQNCLATVLAIAVFAFYIGAFVVLLKVIQPPDVDASPIPTAGAAANWDFIDFGPVAGPG